MKFKFILIFLFFLNISYSQNFDSIKSKVKNADNDELLRYVERAKKDGVKLSEAESIILMQGGTQDEIRELRKLWNQDISDKDNLSYENIPVETSFGITADNKKSTNKPVESERFGGNFFINENISETPQLFVSTPKDYRLGPGDEIIVDLFGASENSYSATISINGTVKFEKVAPIFLSGLSFEQAKKRLKSRLSKIYVGLNSPNPIERVDIDVSLKKARSIVVNIVGNVVAPGTYTISGFSSVINALYSAGGPSEIGTYRNIKILRAGSKDINIDLYDYFTKGIFPSVGLRDQDVIFVPVIKKEVTTDIGFRTSKKFELKNDENLLDLINYSGGFLPGMNKDNILIKRVINNKTEFIDSNVDNSNIISLEDGDFLSLRKPNEYIENKVIVSGSIRNPGVYSLDSSKNIKDLLINSNGFTRNALLRGILFRSNKGVQDEIISINFNSEELENIFLEPLDSLYIPSISDLSFKNEISVVGAVKSNDNIDYKKNMTLQDAIILSGGFIKESDPEKIIVYRSLNDDNQRIESNQIKLNLDFQSDKNFKLEPNDLVSVKSIENMSEIQNYTIKGEINNPGSYVIEFANEKVSDALKKINFKLNADKNSIHIERDSLKIPIEIGKNLEVLNDFKLIKNDVINVPEFESTVRVEGEVYNESLIPYDNSINTMKAIRLSGGFKNNADKKKVYVIRKNGSGDNTKVVLGFKKYPKIRPGDIIYVPIKEEKDPVNAGEVLSLVSGLTSIIALIQIISNN